MSAIVMSDQSLRRSRSRAPSSSVSRSSSRAATAYGGRSGTATEPIRSGLRLEVALVAHAAGGADPVVGHLTPRRARPEALTRVAGILVVDVAATGTAKAAHAAAPWAGGP